MPLDRVRQMDASIASSNAINISVPAESGDLNAVMKLFSSMKGKTQDKQNSKEQKPEKRDYKQEFLDKVANDSGPLAAATMEQAFKHQDKQLQQAMLEQGTPINDVSKIVAGQVGGPQREPPKGPLGMFSLGSDTEQPGALAKLFSLGATGQLYKPDKPSSSNMDPVEQESYQLNNTLKKLQIAQIQNTGEIPTSEQLLKDIPPEEQEDYIIKPVKQTIRGIVNTVPILERKKTLPAKQLEDLGNFENTQKDLGAVVDRLQKSGLQLGPGFSTRPGAISDMLGQIKGPEFAAMKADIGRNFQLYRKTTTGVAAGYPELNMLAPNYPKATDTNETFIQKSIDVMKDIQRNREIMLDHFNKGGYAVSKLKNTSGQQAQSTQTQGPQPGSEEGGYRFKGGNPSEPNSWEKI